MNKYIVKITALGMGLPSGAALGVIVYAANTTDADTVFRTLYPGFTDSNSFSYTIALSV